MSLRRKIFLVLSCVMMGGIFIFSSKPGDESTEQSNTVGMQIGEVFVDSFDTYTDQMKQEFIDSVDYPIRKIAHMMEYATLAMLLFGAFYEKGRGTVKNRIIPWGIATLYAVSDEIHQLFVPNRAGMITDVFIDSAGAILGIIFASLVLVIVYKIKDKLSASK